MSKKRNSKKFRKKLRNRANSTKNSFRKNWNQLNRCGKRFIQIYRWFNLS